MLKTYLKCFFFLIVTSLLVACASYSSDSGLANVQNPPNYEYSGNLWNEIASQLSFPDETADNPIVRDKINFYLSHPNYLKIVTEQARPYLYYVYRQVKRRGLPTELALLPMVESAYNPFAYSSAGAAGLWQMMPGTASGFGLKVDWWYDGRRDIVASTNSALDYLSYLGNYFHQDWLLAIAAYDTGEGLVNTSIQQNLKAGKPTNFWSIPLPIETQHYVPKLLALAVIIKHHNKYHVTLPPIPNAPFLAQVNVGSQIDLSRAAKMANLSLPELASLNPGFNRWATDPEGPYTLLLPIDKVATFEANLSKMPQQERVTWTRYVVKNGDTLSNIAKSYKTTMSLLQKVNRLKTSSIRVGQTLLIPTETNILTKIVLHSEQNYFQSVHSIPEIHITKHTVANGDTLEKIAKKYHVTEAQIRFWNGLRTEQALSVGKELILWPPQKHYFQNNNIISYQVKSGDSLHKIAHQYNTNISNIKKANHLKNNNVWIGQNLKIPKTYTYTSYHRSPKKATYRVESGDTLLKIAEKNHVTVTDLKNWNQISNTDHLRTNQTLVIYK